MSKNQKAVGLTIALPNGSLKEATDRVFNEMNLSIQKDVRKHDARIDSPLFSRVTEMRPQIIPYVVERGTCDVGICGKDCVWEASADVNVLAELPYGRGTSSGKARVVLVASKSNPVKRIQDVEEDSVVLSEYPSLTAGCLQECGLSSAKVHFSHGGTEAHIPRDYRYGVCLTETGASLEANGLTVIHTLLETHTCLIVNPKIWSVIPDSGGREHPKRQLVIALKQLLLGTLAAHERVFLVMNVEARNKDRLLKQLPALKTPTVTPLAGGGAFSVGAVVLKAELATLIPALFMNGAEDLIELPLMKVIKGW